ncbi:BA75_04551T0 [Komagataella pastoris]|uniref:BA75_04551T0 n=1 Tax=Komagataella pastoris TaxID=4922 RepID=A0A1B2JH95_PICPA|nr:BA75_04551T0 [Komagataella pastoris]
MIKQSYLKESPGLGNRFKHIFQSSSNVELRIKHATNNELWGPTADELQDISQHTFDPQKLQTILAFLRKRLLKTKNKQWKSLLKSLTVILFCLQSGSNEFVNYWKRNCYLINTLKEFQYSDEEIQSLNIRNKARYVSYLLTEEEKLASKREDYHKLRTQMTKPGVKKNSQKGYATIDSDDEDLTETLDFKMAPRSTRSLDITRSGLPQQYSSEIVFSSDEEDGGGDSQSDCVSPIKTSYHSSPRRQRSLLHVIDEAGPSITPISVQLKRSLTSPTKKHKNSQEVISQSESMISSNLFSPSHSSTSTTSIISPKPQAAMIPTLNPNNPFYTNTNS